MLHKLSLIYTTRIGHFNEAPGPASPEGGAVVISPPLSSGVFSNTLG